MVAGDGVEVEGDSAVVLAAAVAEALAASAAVVDSAVVAAGRAGDIQAMRLRRWR